VFVPIFTDIVMLIMIHGTIPGMIIIVHTGTADPEHITVLVIMIRTGLVFIAVLMTAIITTHGIHGVVILVMVIIHIITIRTIMILIILVMDMVMVAVIMVGVVTIAEEICTEAKDHLLPREDLAPEEHLLDQTAQTGEQDQVLQKMIK